MNSQSYSLEDIRQIQAARPITSRCDRCGHPLARDQRTRWCVWCLEAKLANPTGQLRDVLNRLARLEAELEFQQRSAVMARDYFESLPVAGRILCVLRERAGQLVTKAEIQRRVWGVVDKGTADSLRVYIGRIRTQQPKPPGGELRTGERIETEHMVGYRLITEEDMQ